MNKIQIRYLVLPLLVAIVVYVGYLFSYLGAWKPVIVAEKKMPAFQLIYKEHIGTYYKIVPTIEEVEKWAKAQGLDCRLSFGLYLNDPKTTEESRLRSRGGCVVDKLPESLPEGFQSQTIPEKNYVTATFEGSAGIGPMKVYPKAVEYFENQKLEREEWTLEIYEIHSEQAMTTKYFFPIKD